MNIIYLFMGYLTTLQVIQDIQHRRRLLKPLRVTVLLLRTLSRSAGINSELAVEKKVRNVPLLRESPVSTKSDIFRLPPLTYGNIPSSLVPPVSG
jgi:hypothetical protein